MDSIIVNFSGKSSVLQSDFFPAITLDQDSNYSCSLLDFTAYNTIPNVENEKHKFEFIYTAKVKQKNGKFENVPNTNKSITFFTGSYEVEDILKYLKERLLKSNIKLSYEISAATSRVVLTFDTTITCTNNSVLKLLGFTDKQKEFKSGQEYVNEKIVKISSSNVIRIECDLVTNSYNNGKNSNTLYEFSNGKVEAGYKLIEIPRHIVYLPIRKRQIDSIQIKIVDESNNLLNFRGEEISCRVHIRKDH